MWRPGVTEHLGYYVYVLSDPTTGTPFYIGKGVGGRCFQHIVEARKTQRDSVRDYPKLQQIRAIEDSGASVSIEILRHGLDEPTAHHVESAAIDLLGLHEVHNRVAGHGTSSGRATVDDINARYGAVPVQFEPSHRFVLIRVSRDFRRSFDAEALYEVTRKWWRMDPHRRKPEYAAAVYDGVIRAVYRIDGWERPTQADLDEDPHRQRRWAFIGHLDRAMTDRYRFAEVTAYLRPGARNPITYVNC